MAKQAPVWKRTSRRSQAVQESRCCWGMPNSVAGASPLHGREGGFRGRDLAALVGATLVLNAAIAPVGAVEFQAGGEMRARNLLGTTNTQTADFEVFVRDHHWLIRVHQTRAAAGETNAMLLNYCSFGDGDTIYTAAYAPRQALASLLAQPRTPAEWKRNPELVPINMAWIEKSRVPHADSTLALPASFYAYCSQAYLDGTSGHGLEPAYYVDGRTESFHEGATNMAANLSRSRRPPYLPERIEFLHSEKLLVGPGRWEEGPPEQKGFTNVIFQVSGWTNVGNLTLPEDFSVSYFFCCRMKGVPGVRLVAQNEFHLLRAASQCGLADLKPALEGHAEIHDWRLNRSGVSFVVGYSTNKWLDEDSLVKLPEYKSAVLLSKARMAEHYSSPDSGRRVLILGLLAVSICTPLLLWLASRRGAWARNGNSR